MANFALLHIQPEETVVHIEHLPIFHLRHWNIF